MIEETQFFDPEEEIKAKADIKRRRAYAERLRESAQPTGNEMVSGIVVKKSPIEGLAKMLQSGMAGYNDYKATESETQNKANQQKLLAEALGQYKDDPNAAAQMLMQSPEYSSMGAQLITGNADRERAYKDKLNFMQESAPFELEKAKAIAEMKSQYGGANGGDTQFLINSLVEEDNGINSQLDALRAIKGGAGQAGKNVSNIDTGAAANFANQSGKNQSDLQYNPQIAAATKIAEMGAEYATTGQQGLVQQKRTLDSMRLQDDFINTKAQEVYAGMDGLFKTGFTGSMASAIKGTQAYALQENIKTLTADSGINSLLEAKAKGATFGALQEKELDLLIALKGSLDQGLPVEQLKSNLDQFLSQREKVFSLMEQQYGEDVSRFGSNPATVQQADKPISEMTLEELQAIAGGQ